MISEAVSAIQSALFDEDRSVLICAVFIGTVDDRVREALKSLAKMIACNKIKVGPVYFERLNLVSQHNRWSNRTRMARTVEFRITRRFDHDEDLAPFINSISPALEEIRALMRDKVEATA